jgi:2-polyprenyl-3-methyl-5-hydroxy-6-metoxy-1,4-benzoquinol methylase
VTAGLDARARQSLGTSDEAIHAAVSTVLAAHGASGVLADIGCGTGDLWRAVGDRFSRYIAVDAVRYEGLPGDADFRTADLDRAALPLRDGEADAAVAAETIEHLENPRALARELVRIVRPGGVIVVTTPNQLSLLSLATLIVKRRFAAFQDTAYPAHLTALLEVDLRRMAAECGLEEVTISYTLRGRVPLTAAHYPRGVARMFPRALSDNVVLAARRPGGR